MKGRLLQLVLIGLLLWGASILGMLAVSMTAKPAHAEEKPFRMALHSIVNIEFVSIDISRKLPGKPAYYIGSGLVKRTGEVRMFLLPTCAPEGSRNKDIVWPYKAEKAAQQRCMAVQEPVQSEEWR